MIKKYDDQLKFLEGLNDYVNQINESVVSRQDVTSDALATEVRRLLDEYVERES